MCKDGSVSKTGTFVERTLAGIIAVLREAVSNETLTAKNGLLQNIDPRFKIVSIFLLIISVILTTQRTVMLFLYALCLILAIASRVRLKEFLGRTLPFIPLFSLFIVIPAMFNFVTPGKAVWSITLLSHTISLTEPGLQTASTFLLRILTSVSLATLLVMTTRHHVILKVMRIFHVPQIFVMTMGMTYRYIFLLLDIVYNMFSALKSRVGFVASTRTGRKVIARNMAGLWLQTYRIQNQVYGAMLARGYCGEPRVIDDFRAGILDFVFIGISTVFCIGTVWLNQFLH